MPLFLVGCFPGDVGEGRWPIEEGKQPIKVNGLFLDTPKCWKTKRPINRPMNYMLLSPGECRIMPANPGLEKTILYQML